VGLLPGTAVKKSAGKSGKASKATKKSRGAPTRKVGQQAPTPERYKQIQQALLERGYLQTQANGTWGPESVEALRRFQQDKNLEATGKIDSLSLIALGLGPKRGTTQPLAGDRSREP
jgi:peptidoglycan hydrolase-like protein with peptidoglycan-binding domain